MLQQICLTLFCTKLTLHSQPLWAVKMSSFIHCKSIKKTISLRDLQFVGIYKYHTYLYAEYKTIGKFYQLINMANVFKYS